jgi:hypothetical protein
MSMFEKMFGGVKHGEAKHDEQVYRGEAGPAPKPAVSPDTVTSSGSAARAEQVYSGAASNMASAIERTAKQAKLRDEIELLKSSLSRYVETMAQARQNGEETTVKDMMGAIALGEAKKKALEVELESLA